MTEDERDVFNRMERSDSEWTSGVACRCKQSFEWSGTDDGLDEFVAAHVHCYDGHRDFLSAPAAIAALREAVSVPQGMDYREAAAREITRLREEIAAYEAHARILADRLAERDAVTLELVAAAERFPVRNIAPMPSAEWFARLDRLDAAVKRARELVTPGEESGDAVS